MNDYLPKIQATLKNHHNLKTLFQKKWNQPTEINSTLPCRTYGAVWAPQSEVVAPVEAGHQTRGVPGSSAGELALAMSGRKGSRFLTL